MGGGGGSSGGTVVQQTAPWAAKAAGQIGLTAAKAAGDAASAGIESAMQQLNQQFISASKTIQPYTQEGVQSLNKLNSYIGLNPYNPGKEPVKPTKESLMDSITSSQVRNWAYQNAQYDGPDKIVSDPTANAWANKPVKNAWYITDPTTGQLIGHMAPQAGESQPTGAQLTRVPEWYKEVQGVLAGEESKREMPLYDLNKENWDYAKSSFDEYTAKGPMTTDQIYNDITNQPGYQAQLEQGIGAIEKSGSAKGYLGSGRVLKELNSFGQGTLSTFYNNTLSRLAALAGSGQEAANTQAGMFSNLGSNLASLHSSLGDVQANSILAGAKSQSDALIAANQQFKTIGGGGGGGGGIGQAIGAIGSLASSFGFSSKQLKEDFEGIDTAQILERVNQLDIEKWKYKGIDTKHLGPYAEQFQEVFGIGDGKTINLIDTVGILLASVQELSHKLDCITRRTESNYGLSTFISREVK